MKQYSESCEQNKAPILEVLKQVFHDSKNTFEVGSGTGQHAVYFAKHLPHLTWHPSDLKENLLGIQAWLHDASLENVKPPIEFDVLSPPVNLGRFDAVFTANSLHIMSWSMVQAFFQVVSNLLEQQGKLLVYGPFSYQGAHTSLSNERFDLYLKQRNPDSGVRDFVDVDQLAKNEGLELVEDYAMPANNRSLLWQKC
ncbi:MAG: DUF938 domain-containing protein [Pseudomonadota bacterium]